MTEKPIIPNSEFLESGSVPPPTFVDTDTLSAALARHGISLSAKKTAKLEKYCALLWDWNTRINLTRHTDYEKFVSRDVKDAQLAATFLLPGEQVLDVGTGGGVPGILLCILRPDLKIDLCDSTGKKAKVVGEIADALKIDTPVWHAKAEELLKVHRYTTLVVRAVAKMTELLKWFMPRWYAFDRMLMFKGPGWIEERGECRHLGYMKNLALRKIASHTVPGTDAESVLLQLCQKDKFATLEETIVAHAKNIDGTLGVQGY